MIPGKKCSVCEKLRDRQYFSDREWLRMKTNTPDGTCIECTPLPRCANGSRRCRLCKTEKLLEAFTMWFVSHGYRSDRQVCDTCMQPEELKKQNMRKRNKADVQVTQDGNSAPHIDMNPRVTMFCPKCNTAQSIEMIEFWNKGSKGSRFVECSCTSEGCKQKRKSLGNWLRFEFDPSSKISAWLKSKGIYDNCSRPANINVIEYMERQEVADQNNKKRES